MSRRSTPRPLPSDLLLSAPTRRVTRRVMRVAAMAMAGVIALSLGACGDEPTGGDPERVDVIAAFYPLQFAVQRIGGDAVNIKTLAKPGAEPHDMELSPAQVGQVSDAELIVYVKGFQAAVDDAVDLHARDHALDVTTTVPLLSGENAGHQHEGEAESADHQKATGRMDPHVWLDPIRLATIGDALAARLGEIDKDRAAEYTARAVRLRGELEALNQEYVNGLQTCQRRELVVSHAAFGYLANRYRLEQISLSGLSPEVEPSSQRLGEVIEEAREHKATTIFFETLVSPKVAETIAREVGARTAVLDPIEGLRPDRADDYFSVMRKNLAVIRPALGCA